MKLKLVLANGCFDLLHAGHVAHLKEAQAMGVYLVVGLTLDRFVNKAGRPIQSFDERRELLLALRYVDDVFGCKDGADAIRTERPDIFVKGPDYAQCGLLPAEYAACAEVGAQIRFTTAPKQSTTALIERIKCAFC